MWTVVGHRTKTWFYAFGYTFSVYTLVLTTYWPARITDLLKYHELLIMRTAQQFVGSTAVCLRSRFSPPSRSSPPNWLVVYEFGTILEIHACSNPSPLFPNIVSTWSISGYINSERRLTLHASCYYGNTINVFFYFSEKRHKIVEFFALLTTELASYKMCKVGMLFCTLQASI